MVHDSPENKEMNRSARGGSSDDASTASAEVTHTSSLPPPSPISSPSPTLAMSRPGSPGLRYSPTQHDDEKSHDGVILQQWPSSTNGDTSRHSGSPRSRASTVQPQSPADARSRSHSPAKQASQAPRKTPEFAQPAGKTQHQTQTPFSPRPSSKVRSFSPGEENSGALRTSPANSQDKVGRPSNPVPQLTTSSPQQGVEITGIRTNRANIMNANATALFDGGIKKDRQRAAAHVVPTSAALEPVATFTVRARHDLQSCDPAPANSTDQMSPTLVKRINTMPRDRELKSEGSRGSPSAFHRIHEGSSKEEIEALLEDFRNRRPEIIEEFLHNTHSSREPSQQREGGETYSMVRAPQQFQHLRTATQAASAIVAVPNVQVQPSPAKRPRVASSSMEIAINELGLNQYLQPSVGQRPQPQQPSPPSGRPQQPPEAGVVIDITGADSDDHKAKYSPLAMVNEVLKQLLDLQKKIPMAIKEAQRAQAQLVAAQRPIHGVRSNGTAVVSPVRDDFEIAHTEQQLYRVQQSLVPTTILNRLEAAPQTNQRKQSDGLKNPQGVVPNNNGQVAPTPEFLITMGIPHQQGREQGPMDLTSSRATPMLMPAPTLHSNVQHQQSSRCMPPYPTGHHENQSRNNYRSVSGRPQIHRYNPAVERVSPPVTVERVRRNSIPISSPPHLSRNRVERQGAPMQQHYRREMVQEALAQERMRFSSSGHHRASNQATITVVPLPQQQPQRPPLSAEQMKMHHLQQQQQHQQHQQQQQQQQQQMQRKHSTTGHCLQCQRASGYVCSSCKTATYCSSECQNQHWPKHEQECMSRLLSKDNLSASGSLVARSN